MNAKQLRDVATELFAKKTPLDSLWQEISDNFYPERANFTLQRSLGTDFAANLMTSYPILCRRDLGNQFSTMLRPTAKPWFHIKREYADKDDDNEVKQWLQKFETIQRRAMYDPDSSFTRATKEGDQDFAAFGQCALSIEVNHNPRKGPHLLYRCWHLKDMTWQENEIGKIGAKFRKWKTSALVITRTFKNVHQKIKDALVKAPFTEFDLMHMVVEADMYDDNARGRPFWSIWYDVSHDTLIEAVPIWTEYYVIPRWQTVSGSQYSYSPSTVAALPDARLIQAMTYTLLEAGEKATNPPMIATQDAVRSDVSTYAGGLTWVDYEYDERLGEALRPIAQDFRGFNYGVELNERTKGMIKDAFFLNSLKMPDRAPEMTAYEVGQRIQEYIRSALPIFEPMEMEYNAALCNQSFELLWRNMAFGSPLDWPKQLIGAGIEFTFESPLHDAIDSQKGQIFQQAQQMIAGAVAMDPTVSALPNVVAALRDSLNGIGVPASWLNSEDQVNAAKAQQAAKQNQQQLLANMEQGSNVAKNLGVNAATLTGQPAR